MSKIINVNKPFLPPQNEYEELLKSIWKTNWLTNNGALAERFENEVKLTLNSTHPLFVTNGTIALQLAIKALDLSGEIITTPYSFVATTSTIIWQNCKPIFVDIDPFSLNIDPSKIEKAITKNTSAIIATHVYGNPCDVVAIEKIAKKHNLKVIYDGAHAFGVEINGISIFNFGDITTCSLHATKLLHSVEGGLIFAKDQQIFKKIFFLRKCGFLGPDSIISIGINATNSEFHAAMGLTNLKYFGKISQKRQLLYSYYVNRLKGLKFTMPIWHKFSANNNSYFPVIFESEKIMKSCFAHLADNGVFARRYFYPSLSNGLPYLENQHMPISEDTASRVLCLPFYFDLTFEDIDLISTLIRSVKGITFMDEVTD